LHKLVSGSFGFENSVDVELFVDGRFTGIGHGCDLGVHSDGIDPVGKVRSINAMLGEIQDIAPVMFREKRLLVNYTQVGIFAVFPGQASSSRVE
jgi:hypothetical protein